MEQPNKIYEFIVENIQSLETELSSLSSDEQVDNAKKQVLQIIQEYRSIEIDKSLAELKQNQEWDTFTIAFYGETNAGKSTIIESLRIYFQEETKLEINKKFQEIFIEYKAKSEWLEQELSKSKSITDENEIKYTTKLSDFEAQKDEIEKQISNKNKLEIEKREKSICYRFISFLNFSSIKKDINILKLKLSDKTLENQNELINIKEILELESKKIEDFTIQLNKLHELSIQTLNDLADGQIIGDGRSDFTQQTTQYLFVHNKQKFAFLDVPGIEGKEVVVIDEIASAVKKAHAVFYVTSNPVSPQKGNDSKKGTLEKIKEHLSSQTEVYTIFNKRITNPIQLEKTLINEDEKLSLEVLNTKMAEVIGVNYIGNKNLSAKISFLALAECLTPNSKMIEEKNKFLKKFTKNDLLEKALLVDFTNFLTNNLVQNTKQKIKKSNFNKANNVLTQLISILTVASKDHFQPLYKQLVKESQDASKNLHNTLKTTKNRMKSEVEKITRNFESKTRQEIYRYVDTNISDDSFKYQLESIIEEKYEKVVSDLPISLEKEIQIFQTEINKVIENFKRRADATIQDFKTISFDTNNTNFSLDVKFDNGIDGWGATGSLAGAGGLAYSAIMFGNSWNPVGWTMFALGVVTVLVGFGKSIFKFFSDSYKMSEQKKVADENINEITQQIKNAILEKLELAFLEFEKATDAIIDDLESSVEQVKKANNYIIDSNIKLIQLSKNIQKEGHKQ